MGAYDFHQKPADPELIALLVARAYHVYELEMKIAGCKHTITICPLRGIITSSPQMLKSVPHDRKNRAFKYHDTAFGCERDR